jgi:uncharacterized membrane protein YbhN (UPF0104 family)
MAVSSAPKHFPGRSRIVLLIIFLLLLYVVVPRIGNASDSISALGQADWRLVGLAAVLVVATYAVASCTYQLLAIKPLHFQRTLAVQAASAFANRVLPAGIGGLTLNVQYLRRSRHTLPQAVAVASTNNILGLIGHVFVLAVMLVVSGGQAVGQSAGPQLSAAWYVIGAIVVFVVVALFAIRKVRRPLGDLIVRTVRALLVYKKHPAKIAGALCCSILLTLSYVAVFYVCAQAIGATLSPMQSLIVFTVGMAIGTATPTPGGLGGIEAGLVAGSVACGETASTALAAALLYRLLTYWLPLLPGFLTLLAIRSRYL